MAAPSAVDYAGLKSWIAQQESYEVAYSRPAPLTSAQQQAIAVLLTPVEHQAVAVLQAPAEYQAVAVLRAPVSPEPDIGNTDWVSALHRHRDARPRGATIKHLKEAKQFAAKECVMSLIVNKRMSGDRLNVTFPNFKY
ncbi:hypothetical protein P8C59_008615 [Phyllachora maydis]|uniref:Uncharacterized protein n=1 Tax=Phyllachora maydis TaxID=1825666 RepID=A0AAD9ICJ7_9PEZI|nr:hypothetical protein P8C59_008615 [Phyllachora maydis]